MMSMRTCLICRDAKPLSAFWKAASRRDGLSPYCKSCDRQRKKESRARNPESTKSSNERGREKYRSKHRSRVLEQGRHQSIKKRGLTVQTYQAMLEKQHGGCAICERLQTSPRLAVDHDHRTGRVRGLLCSTCNTALGKFRDSVDLLKKAASYLEEHSCRLIALSGKKSSGKDTSADLLVKQHGFTRIAFAAPLKAAVRTIFGWTDAHTDGPLKEVVDPAWNLSPRVAMQRLGTDVGRNMVQDLWVRSLERKLQTTWKEDPTAKFVVTDCRFPNEAALIKELGGQVWRVERPSLPVSNDLHPSETSLDNYKFDVVLMNDGTLEDLYAKVEAALRASQP